MSTPAVNQPSPVRSSGIDSALAAGYQPADLDPRLNSNPHAQQPQFIIGKAHRGGLLLTMGIFSLLFAAAPIFIGIPLQVLTWVLARKDLKEIASGIRDPDGRKLTNIGRILAIVGFAISIIKTVAG